MCAKKPTCLLLMPENRAVWTETNWKFGEEKRNSFLVLYFICGHISFSFFLLFKYCVKIRGHPTTRWCKFDFLDRIIYRWWKHTKNGERKHNGCWRCLNSPDDGGVCSCSSSSWWRLRPSWPRQARCRRRPRSNRSIRNRSCPPCERNSPAKEICNHIINPGKKLYKKN